MTSLRNMCVCAVSSGTVRPAAVINEFLLEEVVVVAMWCWGVAEIGPPC